MMRQIGAFVILAVLCMGVAANGQPLRKAEVGSPMKDLLTGLNRVERGAAGRCGGADISVIDFILPSRTQDHDSASFIGFWMKDRLAILVAYDEEDLSVPVTVYADLDGAGNVTNVWAVEKAPHPCTILSQMR